MIFYAEDGTIQLTDADNPSRIQVIAAGTSESDANNMIIAFFAAG